MEHRAGKYHQTDKTIKGQMLASNDSCLTENNNQALLTRLLFNSKMHNQARLSDKSVSPAHVRPWVQCVTPQKAQIKTSYVQCIIKMPGKQRFTNIRSSS